MGTPVEPPLEAAPTRAEHAATHEAPGAALYVRAAHGTHALAAEPPVAARVSLPAGHSAHALTFPRLYELAGQAEQVVAFATANVPAAQTAHVAEPTAPATEPAGHGAHVALLVPPGDAENVPTGQREQAAAPASAKAPAAHTAHDAEPAALNEPAGHGAHVAALVLPMAAEKVPAGQRAHVTLPEADALANVPAPHGAQPFSEPADDQLLSAARVMTSGPPAELGAQRHV